MQNVFVFVKLLTLFTFSPGTPGPPHTAGPLGICPSPFGGPGCPN